GRDNGIRHVKFLEVLYELGNQLLCLARVVLRAGPGGTRVQQLGVSARNVLGDIQAHSVQALAFHVVQITVLNSGNNGAGRRNAEALAFTKRTAGPASVDQEHLAAELVDALHQQFRIYACRTWEERSTETGGESRLELGRRAHFGRTNQCSVTTQEVISGSFTAQDRYRRQYAGHVAGQEDDMRWLTGAILDDALLNMLKRVGATRVFGKGNVGVIRLPGFRVDHHVFNDGTKADGIPDDRFVLLAQVDALGVAATFNV